MGAKKRAWPKSRELQNPSARKLLEGTFYCERLRKVTTVDKCLDSFVFATAFPKVSPTQVGENFSRLCADCQMGRRLRRRLRACELPEISAEDAKKMFRRRARPRKNPSASKNPPA